MKPRTVDVIILLLLGLLCIARATWGLFQDIYIDLSEAKSVTGKVIDADITQIRKTTFKLKKYSTVFSIRLENSDEYFTIDRGTEFCKYLKSKIKVGDAIKLIYRLSTSEQNSAVYQIEKNETVLASYSDYRKKETRMIILGYTFGFLIFGALSFWYVKRNQAKVP